jgi:dTDP-4-dehydrorhamnose 3,5-epimerase
MEFKRFEIEGPVLIIPRVFEDERGFFLESYNEKVFKENGIDVPWVQDNHSKSIGKVLRGMHFQLPPHTQDKLVRVIKGKVLDVIIDLRKDSPTFKKWVSVELSEENKHLFFVPKGFAHGFITLTDEVEFQYKVSSLYNKESDRGLAWNDPEIGIEWPYTDPILSPKDQVQPTLQELIERGEVF